MWQPLHLQQPRGSKAGQHHSSLMGLKMSKILSAGGCENAGKTVLQNKWNAQIRAVNAILNQTFTKSVSKMP